MKRFEDVAITGVHADGLQVGPPFRAVRPAPKQQFTSLVCGQAKYLCTYARVLVGPAAFSGARGGEALLAAADELSLFMQLGSGFLGRGRISVGGFGDDRHQRYSTPGLR